MSDLAYGLPAASGDGAVPEAAVTEEPAAAESVVVAEPEPEPEAEPEPLGVVFRETGNAEVDAAVARLADADELPTAGHVEVYEDVHSGLRDALTALDENRS